MSSTNSTAYGVMTTPPFDSSARLSPPHAEQQERNPKLGVDNVDLYSISSTSLPTPTSASAQQESFQSVQTQQHLSHLPPPYAPIDHNASTSSRTSPSRGTVSPLQNTHQPGQRAVSSASTRASPEHLQNHRETSNPANSQQSQNYPGVMVYPPPPPGAAEHQEYQHAMYQPNEYDNSQRRGSVQLPSMGSWAPPAPDLANGHPGGWTIQQHNTYSADPNSYAASQDRSSKRRSSDAEQVEAGIALAGLGLGYPAAASESRPKKDLPAGTAKKARKEETKTGKEGSKKSCAECRRLKAKCDRQFPCSNCRRRGCALVCPDGDLSCMQGKRLVLASTEQLHDRIAQLESALAQAHGQMTPSTHPLLAPQFLDGGFASEAVPAKVEAVSPTKRASTSPSLRQGQATVPELAQFSPRANSSVSSYVVKTPQGDTTSSRRGMAVGNLLLEGEATGTDSKGDQWVGTNAAPALIVGDGELSSPQADLDERQVIADRLRNIMRVLPSREEAHRRCVKFWQSCEWYNTILRQPEFESIYEPAVYAPIPSNPLTPHKLACVLMVLTLESYFDLTTEEEDPSIVDYWEGAQQCFDTRFGWSASLAGVQALALATLFVGFGWRGANSSNFYWLRLMTSAVQQLGLHKDPPVSLPEEEKDFRRRIFWDAYSLDCLVSINHGQITATPLDIIDTKSPNGGVAPVQKVKYEYMKSIKTSIINIGCLPDSAPAPWERIKATKDILMHYDVSVAPELHCPGLTESVTQTVSDPTTLDLKSMFRMTTSMCHYKAMLFLYRPSLRRLIARLRNAKSPEESPLSDEDKEVISMTYGACRAITAISAWTSRTHPRLSARVWSNWVQTFSAAVSMTALAIWCGPHVDPSFINLAYAELTEACNIVKENGSKRSQNVLTLMPLLQQLVHNRYPQVIGGDPNAGQTSIEAEDMVFALLGGQVERTVKQGLANRPIPTPAPADGRKTANMDMLAARKAAASQQQPTVVIPSQTHPSGHSTPNSASSGPIPMSTFVAPPSALGQQWHGATPMQMAQPDVAPQAQDQGVDNINGPNMSLHSGSTSQHTMNQNQNHHYPTSSTRGGNSGHSNMGQHSHLQQQQYQEHPAQQQQQQQPMLFDMDLWARLQTFYEPTPMYWGQNMANGYVDYGYGVPGGMGE